MHQKPYLSYGFIFFKNSGLRPKSLIIVQTDYLTKG